jgi:hypothetical protein
MWLRDRQNGRDAFVHSAQRLAAATEGSAGDQGATARIGRNASTTLR